MELHNSRSLRRKCCPGARFRPRCSSLRLAPQDQFPSHPWLSAKHPVRIIRERYNFLLEFRCNLERHQCRRQQKPRSDSDNNNSRDSSGQEPLDRSKIEECTTCQFYALTSIFLIGSSAQLIEHVEISLHWILTDDSRLIRKIGTQ